MPDVRMPDGTIIRNVPEGTTRAQLMSRYGKARAPKASKTESFLFGIGDSRTFGFLDEGGAILDTLGIGGSGEDRPNIWRGDSFSAAREENLRRNRAKLGRLQGDNPGSFMSGQVTGAILPGPSSKVALATKAGKALTAAQTAKRATMTGKAGKLAANVAPDLARGALYGAGSAEDGNRVGGAVEGVGQAAVGHAGGRAIGAGVGRALKGKTVSPAVRELADAGVVMTPGQRAGPGSIRKSLEEGVLGSLPVVKAVPNAAKRRGVEQLNIAAINRALEPIGFRVPKGVKPGQDLINKASDAVYSAYDTSVGDLVLGSDSGLSGAARAIKGGAKAKIGPAAGQLEAIVDRTMAQLDSGPVAGSRVRDIMSELRGEASNFASSSSANERNIGKELWRLHDHLDSALVRQNKAGRVEGFKKAREAVANFKRIEAAAAKSPDRVFSPTQLQQAVTKRGYGTTTGKVSRGEARLQSLSDAAKQVLPDNMPNSGTPERAFAASLATGGPGIAALLDPTAGTLTGMSLLGYAPGVDRALQNFAINRPDLLLRLGAGVERAVPALGTAGAMTSIGVNSRP